MLSETIWWLCGVSWKFFYISYVYVQCHSLKLIACIRKFLIDLSKAFPFSQLSTVYCNSTLFSLHIHHLTVFFTAFAGTLQHNLAQYMLDQCNSVTQLVGNNIKQTKGRGSIITRNSAGNEGSNLCCHDHLKSSVSPKALVKLRLRSRRNLVVLSCRKHMHSNCIWTFI